MRSLLHNSNTEELKSIIDDFRPINSRKDKGALWEKFLTSERIKSNVYKGNPSKSYFWRTTSQQEIDYVEVLNDSIKAYKFK